MVVTSGPAARDCDFGKGRKMTRTELMPAARPAKRDRSTRRIIWAVCLILLPLCCATAAPEQDQATLYFFNTSGWKVFPEKLTLLDNDKKIAALNRNEYVMLPISPGHHVFHPKEEKPPKGSPKHEVDLDAKPGVTYYLAGGFTPDMHFFRWTFAEISKDEADKLLAEMKPQAEK
jgi:hypothetical protein